MTENKCCCQNCGAELKVTDITCPKCGKNLKKVGRRMKISVSENQQGKYSLILHESSIPLGFALAIEKNLKLLIDYGLERLDFGMTQWAEVDKFPSFNYDVPHDPYVTKDFYFSATNAIFVRDPKKQICPWNVLPSSLSEIYFEKMLKLIKEYENRFKSLYNSEYHFNKGMVYANLGVMQAAQRKIDEGFANIRKALDEDKGYLAPQAQKVLSFGEICLLSLRMTM